MALQVYLNNLTFITFDTTLSPVPCPPHAPRTAPGPTAAAAVALTVRAPPLPGPSAGDPGPHGGGGGPHAAGTPPVLCGLAHICKYMENINDSCHVLTNTRTFRKQQVKKELWQANLALNVARWCQYI